MFAYIVVFRFLLLFLIDLIAIVTTFVFSTIFLEVLLYLTTPRLD